LILVTSPSYPDIKSQREKECSPQYGPWDINDASVPKKYTNGKLASTSTDKNRSLVKTTGRDTLL
jgi:hypothetical protein